MVRDRPSVPERRGLIITIQAAIVLAAVAALGDGELWGAAYITPLFGASSFLTAQLAWALLSWRLLRQSFFDSYSLFLIALAVFNGGQLLLFSLGLLDRPVLDGLFPERVLEQVAHLVNAGVACFHLGAILAARTDTTPQPSPSPSHRDTAADDDALRLVAIGFLAVGIPGFVASTAHAFLVVAEQGYMGLYQEGSKLGVENWQKLLALFLMPGAVLLIAAERRKRTIVALVWCLTVFSTAVQLALGARAGAVVALVPVLLAHHRMVRPIRRRVLAALVLAALVLFPWIQAVREVRPRERAQVAVQIEDHLTATVREMGQSMATVAYTVTLIPSTRPFDQGASYLWAASGALPNLLGGLHPAVARGTYSRWLIEKVDPVIAALGGGLGFSIVAEAYANFGTFGAVLLLGLAGAALGYATCLARRREDALGPVAECLILGAVIVWPRAEALDVARMLVWTVALPLAIVKLLRPKLLPCVTAGPSGSSAAPDEEGSSLAR